MSNMRKEPLKVDVDHLPDGRRKVKVHSSFNLTNAEIGTTKDAMEEFTVLHPQVTPPRRKLAACRWFLAQLQRCIMNEGSTLMFLEALTSTLRSATFSLQKLLGAQPGFREWFDEERRRMGNDPILRWAVDVRNAAEKEGLVLAEYGPKAIAYYYKDGSVKAERSCPELRIEGLVVSDVVAALPEALRRISLVVEDAHKRFLPESEGRTIVLRMEYVRETDDGGWEHFNPE